MWEQLYSGVVLCKKPYSCVIFSKPVIRTLISYRQTKTGDLEGGGLLLGYIRGNHFDVRYVTQPQAGDLRKRFFFERRDPKHLGVYNRLKKISHNQITFLGEWHSHAESNPTPSRIDIDEWTRIRKNRNYQSLNLIIGISSYYLEIDPTSY